MAKSAFSGPLLVYGQSPIVGGMVSDYNPDLGPSFFYGGIALMDYRRGYFPGGSDTDDVYAFSQTGRFNVIDQVPSTISAVNIAASQVPVAGTPLTLVSSSAAGITVGQSVFNPATGQTVTGLLAIDGVPTPITYGSNTNFNLYNPATAIARNVRITTGADDSAATVTVVGYDIYGYRMTETIALVSTAVASGKKAFKFISSITPAGTLSGTAITVGTGDVFGFPIRSDSFFFANIAWNSAFITATTGYVAAVTTNPATATTGDVRGTYAVQSASDNAKRLIVFVDVPPANIGSVTGVFGVTQA